jgi:hypothetical protein
MLPHEPQAARVADPNHANGPVLLIDDGAAERRDGAAVRSGRVRSFRDEDVGNPDKAIIDAATDRRTDQMNFLLRGRRCLVGRGVGISCREHQASNRPPCDHVSRSPSGLSP